MAAAADLQRECRPVPPMPPPREPADRIACIDSDRITGSRSELDHSSRPTRCVAVRRLGQSGSGPGLPSRPQPRLARAGPLTHIDAAIPCCRHTACPVRPASDVTPWGEARRGCRVEWSRRATNRPALGSTSHHGFPGSPSFLPNFLPRTRLERGREPPNPLLSRAFAGSLCDELTDSSKLVMRFRLPSPALVHLRAR